MYQMIKEMKKKMVMEKAIDSPFPDFIRAVRRTFGTQKMVAEEMGLSSYRLMYLERGLFERMPEDDELFAMGEYFGVQAQVLKRKARNFLKVKHS